MTTLNSLPLPGRVRMSRQELEDPEFAEKREWWLQTGDGGYLSGSVIQSRSRGYHGLSVVAVHPPLARRLVWAKWDACVQDGDQEIPLSSNLWRDGSRSPEGHNFLASFCLEGRLPLWTYIWKDRVLRQRIWFDRALRSVVLSLVLESPEPLSITAKILVTCRDHHGITRGEIPVPDLKIREEGLCISYPELSLHFQCPGGFFQPEHSAYRGFSLPLERERGLNDWEDLLLVSTVRWDLLPGIESGLMCSSTGFQENMGKDSVTVSRSETLALDSSHLNRAFLRFPHWKSAPDWIHHLILSADTFLSDRPAQDTGATSRTILAGLPWFGDWGRDTMVSLPGLLLATGRFEEARDVLLTFGRTIRNGLLPNYFPEDGGTPLYNSADASLWFLRAWVHYVRASSDIATLRTVFPSLKGIIMSYIEGTDFGIGIDASDHLVRIGPHRAALTWMDAVVDGTPVTPRTGKPVELSALWFDALKGMSFLCRRLRESSSFYEREAEKTREGFQRFWNPGTGSLWDILDGPTGDIPAIRPNQVFALSLDHTPLDRPKQERILEEIDSHLLTPYGLRSLSPRDPEYRGRYEGSPLERDRAYHQGTVWGWLLGHYALAHFRLHGDKRKSLSVFCSIEDHLSDAGLGGISEIFDGEPPHTPRGCPFQAWSVGCVLEAYDRISRAPESGIPMDIP